MSQGELRNIVVGGQISYDPSYLSPFGTIVSDSLTPAFQGDYVYGLNIQLWNPATVSGTGATVDTDSARLRVQSGTSSSGYAYITSRRIIRYRAGQGIIARYTPIFTTGVANNVQLIGVGSIVSNAPYDGYFFGYNGTSFSVVHYVRGTPSWTAQSSWNNNHCLAGDGEFAYDPTKGTPVMIKYPYLGFGDIEFYIQVPATGQWILVHRIHYANTVVTTQLSNPSLQFVAFTLNSGNTTNQTMYCGSIGAFLSGERSFVGNPKWATDVTKTGISTEALALSIKNCTTYNGVTNRGLIRLHSVGLGTNTNTYGVLRFRLGATITGTPVYNPINGTSSQTGGNNDGITLTVANSIASVDTAGVLSVGSGTYLWNMPIGATSSSLIDITPFDIFIAPTEILSISLTAANSLSSNVSINWSEDI